jgi:Protein of unknown function (DUF4019)
MTTLQRMAGLSLALVTLAASLVSSSAWAQEFRPYTDAHITAAEWQTYFNEVQAKLGATRREFPEEHLVAFEDKTRVFYLAFTMPGHPAHPAWIARRVVGHDGTTEQSGYFAGDEKSFAALFDQYQDLTKRMRGDMEGEESLEAPSEEARATVEELTQEFLIARDTKDFERAFAMMTPSLQQREPFGDWRTQAVDALDRAGKPEGHDIHKISWYEDPPLAQLPGSYAAVDLNCRYEKLSICNEVLILYRTEDGQYRVMRYVQNMLDSETLRAMCVNKEHTRIAFTGGTTIDITCPKAHG